MQSLHINPVGEVLLPLCFIGKETNVRFVRNSPTVTASEWQSRD